MKINGQNKKCLVPEIIYFCIIQSYAHKYVNALSYQGRKNKEHFEHSAMLGFSCAKLCAQGPICNKIVLK